MCAKKGPHTKPDKIREACMAGLTNSETERNLIVRQYKDLCPGVEIYIPGSQEGTSDMNVTTLPHPV